MKKKIVIAMCMLSLCGALFTGCGKTQMSTTFLVTDKEEAGENHKDADVQDAQTEDAQEVAAALEDGVYEAEFHTDSSMFHVNEACDGKGTLTVKDGKMVIHISLTSKNIVNLYPGLAEDAKKEGAQLLQPTVDTVTYSDDMTEEVNGFDVPVPALDTEFDLALIGTKGTWYDHKVSVTNPVLAEDVSAETPDQSQEDAQEDAKTNASEDAQTANASESGETSSLNDGRYTAELTFTGGSGKAQILSPAIITAQNGRVTATVEWSSPNYDYMIVDGEKYFPVNTEGNSVFEIPVAVFDEPITVIGDTVAMSKPHEVEYTITFHTESLYPAE